MKHGHHDPVNDHAEHRKRAIEAMAQHSNAPDRHRAQLQVQQQFFDQSIAEARADSTLTKDAMLDKLQQMNDLYKQSTDEIVNAVQHGVKG